MRPFAVSAFSLTLMLAGSGCAVMTANNKELLRAETLMASGKPTEALDALAVKRRDDLCAKLDRAVYQSAIGNTAASNAEFDRALAQIKEYESRAVVSGQEVARGAGTAFVNDKVLEYQGEGFEKVLVHSFKARNYLLQGDAEAARVEILNANMRQEEERKRHQEAIDAAKGASGGAGVKLAELDSSVDQRFAPSASIMSRVADVYQNPFATYLSGVVYELNGEPGDAFIDYKKAYDMAPNPVVARDLARLAAKLHRKDEVAGRDLPDVPAKAPAGNTLVIIDNGFAPQKQEIKFPIPTIHNVVFAAVPMTAPVPTNLAEIEVVGPDGGTLDQTHMMVDVEAMAVRNLRDQYPAILVRQAVRLAVKTAAGEAARQAAAQQDATLGLVVQLVSTAYNAASEQADLRAWYGLPRSIHVARVQLPPDATSVKLRMLGPAGTPLSEVEAPVVAGAGGMKLVVGRYINGQTLLAGSGTHGAPATTTASAQ